jgi:hypothetical protein
MDLLSRKGKGKGKSKVKDCIVLDWIGLESLESSRVIELRIKKNKNKIKIKIKRPVNL